MKRKIDADNGPEGGIDSVLEHGVTTVSQALKAARSFEGQKLGRRKKQARDDDSQDAITRLNKEGSILKVSNRVMIKLQ